MSSARPGTPWRVAAIVGTPGALVLLARAVVDGAWPRLAEALLASAMLVLVPLALAFSVDEHRGAPAPGRLLPTLVCAAAWLAAGSLLLAAGPLAGVLALPWLAVAIVLAGRGAGRFLARGAPVAEERAVDVASLSLAFGALWLMVERGGLTLAGTTGTLALLTSLHFHFAGFIASTIAGVAGRMLAPGTRARRAWALATAIVVAGPALVAVGFVTSPALEVASAVGLAAGMLGIGAVLLVIAVAHWHRSRVAAGLCALAACGLVVTMGFACAYAYGRWSGTAVVDLSMMARVHGVANALVFSLGAVVAFTILAPAPRAPRLDAPYSRLFARGRVGADFIERTGRVDERRVATGTVESLDAHARAGFAPGDVHPAVRAFYEHTVTFDLAVRAQWHPLFLIGARLWRHIARRMQQLGLPLDAVDDEAMSSRIIATKADGRDGVRTWIRTWANGDVLFVAAYARTEENGVSYMNIGLPLPFSSLCTLLRFDAQRGGGITVTSLPGHGIPFGDEGIFWVSRLGAVRLPLDEVLHIQPDGAEVTARHELRILGFTFAVFRYTLTRREQRSG